MENEKVWRTEKEVHDGLMDIWGAMKECVANGLHKEGTLPGGLHVRRRAMSLHKSLIRMTKPNVISSTLGAMDWVNLYALAVNEENAGGGRMVTAPTNGAAGIIPAVLMYYMEFIPNPSEENVVDFLLAAAAIGALCKKMRLSPVLKLAVRVKSVLLVQWPQQVCVRYWVVLPRRWRTLQRSVWSTTWG